MDPTTTNRNYVALVVSETDQLQEKALTTIQELGTKLKNERAVKAQIRRFGKQIASDPSQLRVKTLDVVGFASPSKNRPFALEPIVIHEGKPVFVSATYAAVGGDYWVANADEIADRTRIIAKCARTVAEGLAMCEAMLAAIDLADEEGTLEYSSCDPRNITVDIFDDPEGKIAKRLPKWITVEDQGATPDAS